MTEEQEKACDRVLRKLNPNQPYSWTQILAATYPVNALTVYEVMTLLGQKNIIIKVENNYVLQEPLI